MRSRAVVWVESFGYCWVLLVLFALPLKAEGNNCEDFCHGVAEEAAAACREAGGDGNCEEVFVATKRECVARECTPPDPEPPSCEERCAAAAEEKFGACVEAGGNPDRCEGSAGESFVACLKEECNPDPDPEPTCEERCERAAGGALEECLASGVDRQACVHEVESGFLACLVDECGHEPPPPDPTCEELCDLHVAEVFGRCIENGGEPGACESAAHEKREACQRECRGEPPPNPEPPSCEDKCERLAHEVFNQCVEAGNEPGACEERKRDAFRSCVERECRDRPPPRLTAKISVWRTLIKCSAAAVRTVVMKARAWKSSAMRSRLALRTSAATSRRSRPIHPRARSGAWRTRKRFS